MGYTADRQSQYQYDGNQTLDQTCSSAYSPPTARHSDINQGTKALKPGSKYDRNRLGFNSCISCVHALCHIVNRA